MPSRLFDFSTAPALYDLPNEVQSVIRLSAAAALAFPDLRVQGINRTRERIDYHASEQLSTAADFGMALQVLGSVKDAAEWVLSDSGVDDKDVAAYLLELD